MGKVVCAGSSRFELVERHDRLADRRVVSFLDLAEALALLRRIAVEPADLAALRRWAHDEGLRHHNDRHLLDVLAGALAVGRLTIAWLDAAHGFGDGGGGPDEPDKPEPPKPGPKPKPAEKVAELLVRVKDADGKPVEDAQVTAGSIGSKKTDKKGEADFGVVTPGTYDITAEKEGHGKVRNGVVVKDEKKSVKVPDGTKTVVDLIQHPECANVAFFEGSTTRANYFGFDHKTNIVAAANDEYWKPVPDKGTLTAPGDRFKRDAARWVSVATGAETEVEINFDFKNGECIPCIANCTFKVTPANIAEVVTAKVTARKAMFRIKGKAVGEATLKVVCDGKDIGWFHIWCANAAVLQVDVACIVTKRAPATVYDLAALQTYVNDVFRQAAISVDMRDLGIIDLSTNATLEAIENTAYGATGIFCDDVGVPPPEDNLMTVVEALDLHAAIALLLRLPMPLGAPLPRLGAYRLYWYVPPLTSGILGVALDIGSHAAFGFKADSPTARNSMAHELGHCLKLRHPLHDDDVSQFCKHNHDTLNVASPAYDATNTEPSSIARNARANVMANDPTNLMGYWPDRPNRKPLRYHQWKACSRE